MSDIKPVIRGKYIEMQDVAEKKVSGTKIFLGSRKLLGKSIEYSVEGLNLLRLMDNDTISKALSNVRALLEEKRERIEKNTARETGISSEALSYDMDLSLRMLHFSRLFFKDQLVLKQYGREKEYELAQGRNFLILHPSFFPSFSWTLKYVIASLFLRTPLIILKDKAPFYFFQELPGIFQEAGFPSSALSFLPVKKEIIPEDSLLQKNCGVSFYLEEPFEDKLESIFNMSFPFWPRRVFFPTEISGEILDIAEKMEISNIDKLHINVNNVDVEMFLNTVKENGKMLKEEPFIIKGKCSKLPDFAPFYCLEPVDSPEEIEGEIFILFGRNYKSLKEILKLSKVRYIFLNRIRYHLHELSEIKNAFEEIAVMKTLIKD